MEEICQTPFWDLNTTWNIKSPDFTECFKNTILIWVPCLYLWLLLPLEVHYLKSSKTRDIPLNKYNISKLLAITVTTTVSLVEVVHNEFYNQSKPVIPPISSSFLKLSTFTLFAVLTYTNIRRGIRSSGILFIFSLLSLICGIPQFRNTIQELKYKTQNIQDTRLNQINSLLYCTSIFVTFLLNCFADQKPQYSQYPTNRNRCPAADASFLSKLFLFWFDPIVWRSQKKPVIKLLWHLDEEDTAAISLSRFEKAQMKIESDLKQEPSGEHSTNVPLIKCLVLTYWKQYAQMFFLKLIETFLFILNPIMFSFLITNIVEKSPIWIAYTFAFLFLLKAILGTAFLRVYLEYTEKLMIGIRNVLMTSVYTKTFRLSNMSKRLYTTGDINNLLFTDVERVASCMEQTTFILLGFLQFTTACYFLWRILGPSSIAGILISLMLLPVSHLVIKYTNKFQLLETKHEDQRGKFINEIFSGIKVLKMYVWEKSFESKALQLRKEEVKVLKKISYLKAISPFIFSFFPVLIPSVTFGVYVLINSNNILDVKTAFTAVSFIGICQNALQYLPKAIPTLIQANISLTRIRNFLNTEEVNSSAISHDKTDEVLIIENGEFSWLGVDGPPELRNINMKINQGKLIAIVGPLGAGKSSFIAAILGEMHKMSGYVNLRGSVAYVPQQAWILNTSLKENITMGEIFDQSLYEEVINGCMLVQDLQGMADGDLTEIGEKGINLSGGQKQRASLARAVYQNRDIYLLDDPLSAVDSHVANCIFHNVIGPTGLLRNKTRFMVTHNIKFLPDVDYIFAIEEGIITEHGTYHELMCKTDSDFTKFVKNHEKGVNDYTEGTLRKNIVVSTNDFEIPPVKKTANGIPIENKFSEICRKTTVLQNETIEVATKKLIKEEFLETDGVKKNVYLFYAKAIGIFCTCCTFVMFILYQIMSVLTYLWLAKWTTSNSSSQDSNDKYFYLLWYILFGIGQATVSLCGNSALFVGLLNASTKLYHKLLMNVLKWPMWLFDSTPTGRILNRFTSDVQVLDSQIGNDIAMSLIFGGRFLAVITVLIFYMPMCTTVLIPMALFIYLVQVSFSSMHRQTRRIEFINKSPLFSLYMETASGLTSINAFGFQNKFISRLQNKMDTYSASVYVNKLCEWWMIARLGMLCGCVIFVAMVFPLLQIDSLDTGLIAFIITFSMQISKETSWLIWFLVSSQAGILSVERIKEFINNPQEASTHLPCDENHSQWPSKGEIRFQDYKLKYHKDDANLILKGISLTTSSSEKIGIVGRTGAGKSSLIMGLFRMVEPFDGRITIDDVDVSTLGLHLLRSRLTVIPQDPVLFLGTVRFNLDPEGRYTDANIWIALEKAHLKNYIVSLSHGLEHTIEEGGSNFSFGQRQLICLARALLRKTKILILDEATASVDLDTDKLIQETIRAEFTDCTILTIAHRIHTIQSYDKILVLDNGSVVEFDSPTNLMNNTSSIYYKMANESCNWTK